ncbi:CRAL-TRIO domain containing protein, partial [Oryctes borbonicus]
MMPKYQDVDSQYSKDPKIRKEDVRILLEWMARQPHLPKIDEYKVILFLQSCYYRIESAKNTIENYYTVRAHCPEFFANRNLRAIALPMKSSVAYMLPKLSVQGYSVMFAKLIDTNTDHFDCNNLIKYFDMAVSLILTQIGTSEGHALVVDMEGASFGHVAKVNLNSARKYVYFLQEAMPVRVKEIHLLNVSAISQTLVNLVKPFLKGDIVEMLHTHASIDTLFDYIPKEAFPEEYGGQSDTIQEMMAKQKREFEENESYFIQEEKEIADDAKRIGHSKKTNESLGIG